MGNSDVLKGITAVLLPLLLPLCVLGQSDVLPLWPNGAPDAIAAPDHKEEVQFDTSGNIRGYGKVSEALITVFPAPADIANGAAVVICPGGGYGHLAIDKEGYKVAQWLNGLGVTGIVLKYRLPNDGIMKDKSVGPLQDVQEALRTARRNAKKWHLDPDKIGVLGFSAGGHLAATASTLYTRKVYDNPLETSARPDFSILIYPVISMQEKITHMGSRRNLLGDGPAPATVEAFSNELQVDSDTPPAFLVHASDDRAVPVENSIGYYLALKDHDVPVEMHLYESGGHGFGLGTQGTHTYWPQACAHWLRANGIIPSETVYLFSYFRDNGQDGLHLAYSEDGLDWKSLNRDRSFLTPMVGKDKLMRDPCIIKGGDGLYHMVWTVSWTDQGIGYASSKDLINWSPQRLIPVMAQEPTTRNTWAPEISFDPETGLYMTYWASTIPGKFPKTRSKKENGYNHRMYYTTTTDFETFSDTRLLYDPGFNVIDASIQKVGNRFVMFLKDETPAPPQKNIKIAYANNLTGPYSKAGEPITGDYWAEGPTAMEINGTWTVYFDKYTDHTYGAVRSTDLEHWEDISEKVHFPDGARHGTVIPISREELQTLQNYQNGN